MIFPRNFSFGQLNGWQFLYLFSGTVTSNERRGHLTGDMLAYSVSRCGSMPAFTVSNSIHLPGDFQKGLNRARLLLASAWLSQIIRVPQAAGHTTSQSSSVKSARQSLPKGFLPTLISCGSCGTAITTPCKPDTQKKCPDSRRDEHSRIRVLEALQGRSQRGRMSRWCPNSSATVLLYR